MDTNSTTSDQEKLQDNATFVAESLPALLAIADRFAARLPQTVALQDLLGEADSLLLGVEAFAGDLLQAIDPGLVAGLREFEMSSHRGWVAMSRCSTLKLIAEHPDLLRVAAERAHAALLQALTDDGRTADAG